MSENDGRMIFSSLRSNAWDSADQVWLRDIGRVHRAFNTYVSGEVRHAQDDPYAGLLADRVGDIGRSLVLIGERMQEDARIRSAYIGDFGVPILKYLEMLAPGACVTGTLLVTKFGHAAGVVSALTDLVRCGAVAIDRPRVGATLDNTYYGLTPEGRVLIDVPVTPPTTIREEQEGGRDETK